MVWTTTGIEQATAYDVRYRYFSGGDKAGAADMYDRYRSKDLSGFTEDALPSGWTENGWTVTPAAGSGWADITERVKYSGSKKTTLREGVIDWQVSLEGMDYDPRYLAQGTALACLRYVTWRSDAGTVYTSGWRLDWVGCIESRNIRREHSRGGPWKIEVRSASLPLDMYDSPRLVLGKFNVADGASVSVSSTLSQPSLEADQGEFLGGTADVSGGNIVDGKLGTVWISQNAPTTTAQTPGVWPQSIFINEVFFKPYTGFDLWWIELYSTRTPAQGRVLIGAPDVEIGNPGAGCYFVTRNVDGDIVVMDLADHRPWWELPDLAISPGGYAIMCSNKAAFDYYHGSGGGVEFVAEANGWGCYLYTDEVLDHVATMVDKAEPRIFSMHPTDGFIALIDGNHTYNGDHHGFDVVCWGNGHNYVPANMQGTYFNTRYGQNATWVGNGIDISSITQGDSICRNNPGDDANNSAADWSINTTPRPGPKFSENSIEWVQIELPEHKATTTAEITSGATEVPVDDTRGFLSAGDAIVNGDSFAYTGKTLTSFTGVTGIETTHGESSEVFQVISSVSQTGWLCDGFEIERRPGLSKILYIDVYLTYLPQASVRNAGEQGFQSDYNLPWLTFSNGGENVDAQALFSVPFPGPTWVRTIMIVIHQMSDSGRAKINEVRVSTLGGEVNNSGNEDLATTEFGAFMDWFIPAYTWLTEDVIDSAISGSIVPTVIGPVSLAKEPMPRVLADICKRHGAIMRYTYAGGLAFSWDRFMQGGPAWYYYDREWNDDDFRGECELSYQLSDVTGVRVSASGFDGTPYEPYTWPIGEVGSSVKEFDDYLVARPGQIPEIARYLYFRERDLARARLTLRGVGYSLMPGHVVDLDLYDPSLDSTISEGRFMVETVTDVWSIDGDSGRRQWATEVEMRRFG